MCLLKINVPQTISIFIWIQKKKVRNCSALCVVVFLILDIISFLFFCSHTHHTSLKKKMNVVFDLIEIDCTMSNKANCRPERGSVNFESIREYYINLNFFVSCMPRRCLFVSHYIHNITNIQTHLSDAHTNTMSIEAVFFFRVIRRLCLRLLCEIVRTHTLAHAAAAS